MSDGIRELSSAAVDDELGEFDQARLLKALKDDPEQRELWERYHMISDALGDHLPERVGDDLSARVRAAVSREAALSVSESAVIPGSKAIKGPWGGVAIAASVALMAIIGVRSFNADDAGNPSAQVASVPAPSANIRQVASGTRWHLAAPGVENKLNGYLVNHYESAPIGAMPGVLPYASIVGYDSKKQ